MVGVNIILVAALTAAAPDPKQRFSEAIGAALQADERKALAKLEGIDLSSLPSRDQAAAICIRQRFGPASRPAEAASTKMADRALAIYRAYWHSAMTHPDRRAAEEQRLKAELQELLGMPEQTGFDALEARLADALKSQGFHSLHGRTGLLRELMMWSKQDEKLMRVALPEGEHDVKVMLLDDFKSLGWSEYATCGRASTGGWATSDALFAVVPRYTSLDAEEFRVTFLGHEAQHFFDKARFKDLKSWELEYRAKLTELAQANATRSKVLGKFIQDQSDDPSSPHSFANRQVLSDLVRKLAVENAEALATVDAGRLKTAATALLREDSERRVTANGGAGAERGYRQASR